MKRPSIRRKLLVRCGLGVGLLLVAMAAATYLMLRHGLYNELNESLVETAALLANQAELENGSITYEWQEGLGTNSELTSTGLFQYWDETTGTVVRSPRLGQSDLPKFFGTHGEPITRDITLSDGRPARALGMRIYPYALPSEIQRALTRGEPLDLKSHPLVLVVARDLTPVHALLERLRWTLACGVLLALGVGSCLIARGVRVSLAPIRALADQVNARTGTQTEPLDLSPQLPDELIGLASDLNLLLARVAATRQRERDFIRHAAHELRTPIAGLRAAADLALSKERDAREYASFLAICRSSAADLGELVKRLSALARTDQSAPSAVIEPVDLTALLDATVAIFTNTFAQRDITISQTKRSELTVLADRTLTRIILTNLLDNAASYAPHGSRVVIRTSQSATSVNIAISNNLESPLEFEPERLFEPLFRRDPSRSDASAHLGIGLTLSRDAARSMGASLGARQPDPHTLEFVLSIPV